MTDEDAKRFENIVKDTIRPLKELVEVLKNKVGRQELYLTTTSSNVKSLKEQQSVINEKLDEVNQTAVGHTKKLDALWDQTVRLTVDSEEVKTTVNKLEGSVDQMDRKLDRVIDTNTDYGNRIKDIEQIPVIAHELKLKKHH